MRALQWLMVPFGIGLFLYISAYPFSHYAVFVDLEQPVADKKEKPLGRFVEWRNGFLPIRDITRLNNYKTINIPKGLTSGPNRYANPKWLVSISLVCCVVSVCGFMFGWRPKGDPSKKEAMSESFWAFTALGLASLLGGIAVIYGYAWKPAGLAVVSALLGIVLLWSSGTTRRRQN